MVERAAADSPSVIRTRRARSGGFVFVLVATSFAMVHLLAGQYQGSFTDPRPFFVFVPIFLAVAVFVARVHPALTVDLEARTLTRHWGRLAFKKPSTEQLVAITQVTIDKYIDRSSDSPDRTEYQVHLTWQGGERRQLIDAPEVYSEAKALAKKLSEGLNAAYVDRSGGYEVKRAPGQIDANLIERLRSTAADPALTPVANAVARLEVSDHGLELTIPAGQPTPWPMPWGRLVCWIVVLNLWWTTQATVLVALVAFVLAAATIVLTILDVWAHYYCGREIMAVQLSISSDRLVLSKAKPGRPHGKPSAKKAPTGRSLRAFAISLDTATIDDLNVHDSMDRALRERMSPRQRAKTERSNYSYLRLRAAAADITFGDGLKRAELDYLNASIRRFLARHGLDQAVGQ